MDYLEPPVVAASLGCPCEGQRKLPESKPSDAVSWWQDTYHATKVTPGELLPSSAELLPSPEVLQQEGIRILADVDISLYIFIHSYIFLCVFPYFWYVFVYILDFFHITLIVNKRGAPEAPPTH